MMNSMRSFASGFVSKLLMIFLVISFGVWGVGDILRNASVNYAARVGDSSVSILEFQQQKEVVRHQLESMGMKNMNVNAIGMNILRKLVQQKLIVLTMQDLGLYVNEELLSKSLRAQPTFRNPDGTFNSNAFRMVMQSEGLSESTILEQISGDAQMKFLLSSLDVSDVTPPAAVRDLMATSALETRDAWIVNLAPVSLPAAIGDEEIQAFYDKNKAVLYAAPETRTLEYIALKPAQLDELSDKAITPEMLADAAQQQPKASKQALHDRLRSEQRDSALHNFSAAVDDALAGGASLGDAVSKAGITAQPHTLEGVTETSAKTSNDDLVKTVTQQGYQMGQGETSGIVVTPKGTPVIVYVKEVHAAAPQAFDKVAADVRAHVIDQKRREATRTRIQEVKQALSALDQKQATDAQWQKVLKGFNLTARRVPGLARPIDNQPTATDGVPPALHAAIFEHQPGTVAGPLTLENGGQMLAIVTAIHHPDAKAIAAKGEKAEEKSLKNLAAHFNESVQMHAFQSFAERHPVKVNPQMIASPQSDAAPTGDDAP